jgi:hypothetical protein
MSASVVITDAATVRGNVGPAQLSLDNDHLAANAKTLSSRWLRSADAMVDAHPGALQKEKDYMKSMNRRGAKLVKHAVFAAEPMRRAVARYGLEAVRDRYEKAGFRALDHKLLEHEGNMRSYKRLYKTQFVLAARRLCKDEPDVLENAARYGAITSPTNEDKRRHRRRHGKGIESPDPDMFKNTDSSSSDEDIGNVNKRGHAVF